MRKFYNTVLERRVVISGDLITPPYEAGWASEATFFVHREATLPGSTAITGKVQIAANGHDWADEGGVIDLPAGCNVGFVRVRHFGGWLRLVLTGGEAEITVHLSLKE
jgi:hypothetical protein